jgi:hypothetical protein
VIVIAPCWRVALQCLKLWFLDVLDQVWPGAAFTNQKGTVRTCLTVNPSIPLLLPCASSRWFKYRPDCA